MSQEAFNAWKLVTLSPLPTWALVLLCLLAAAGVVLAALGLAKEPRRARRALLVALRVAAFACAVFFLLEPGIRHMQVARVRNRLAVLVDRSSSMGFLVEPGGPTRAVQVADALAAFAPGLAELGERFVVEWVGFDPELGPVTADVLRSVPPRGPRTDLLGALRSLKAGEQGGATKQLSGVLIFSDGADNAELALGVAGKGRAALVDLGVPVSTFLSGKDAQRDLAVDRVKVDDFAFVRNSIQVEVEVRARGFKGGQVTAVLKREGQVVAARPVSFASDDDVQTASFAFTPDQTGRFVYTVEVPVYPDEAVVENNVRSFALKVIRDRLRVLLVVGRPSWDERFLRGLLRQDPNVDLISFYILRTMSDDPGVISPDRELSLIPFPMEEIFDTKLHTFDVVIFQNFGYTDPRLSISLYERNLEQYIHEGGAFLMIGGDHSLGEGRANFATLGLALPVEGAGPADLSEFRPRLTADGLRHPVTAVGASAAGTESLWTELPLLSGANTTRARSGATVLLDHPSLVVDGKSAPVLALWDYGRGRSMVLTVDSSWYWAFTSNAQGPQSRLYDRFWGNALRWLVRDPELTTLKVTADPPSVEPGRPVAVVVAARLPDYQPADGAQVQVDLFSVQERKVIASQLATTGPDGVARLEFAPPSPGAYKLLASARREGKSLGDGEDAVAVRAVGPELADASVRADLLEQISRVTGGRAYRLPLGSLPDVPLLDPPVVEVGRARDEPLWDRWYYLVVLVVLLGAEWLFRRRFGYI